MGSGAERRRHDADQKERSAPESCDPLPAPRQLHEAAEREQSANVQIVEHDLD
jgi:hypothetical protein